MTNRGRPSTHSTESAGRSNGTTDQSRTRDTTSGQSDRNGATPNGAKGSSQSSQGQNGRPSGQSSPGQNASGQNGKPSRPQQSQPAIMQPRPVPRQNPSSPGRPQPGSGSPGGSGLGTSPSPSANRPAPGGSGGQQPTIHGPQFTVPTGGQQPGTPQERPGITPAGPSATEAISDRITAARRAVKEKASAMKDAAGQAADQKARQREQRAADRRASERQSAIEAAELHAAQSGTGYGSGMSPAAGPAHGAAAGLGATPAPPPAPSMSSGAAHYTAPTAKSTPAIKPSQSSPSHSPKASERTKTSARTTHRTRKARLRLARLDPWSVMKTAFLLAIAFGIVTWVAVFIVWSAIGAAGVFDNINRTVQEVLGTPGAEPFRVQDYVSTNKVMGFTTLLACADVLIITALATLGAFLYNIAASLLGGLELTLSSED